MPRLAMAALAALAALFALVASCSGPAAGTRGPAPPTAPATHVAPAPPATSAALAAPADPWSAGRAEAAHDPPSFAATRALADRVCPRVTAPHFYRLEKGGKVSHILGTRHLGVSLDKMPANVVAAIRAAKLAVFEVAPGDDPPQRIVSGPPLPEQLGPELWAQYQRLVGRANATSVERASPVQAFVVMIAMYEHKLAALDLEIQRLVQKAQIPTQGLESAAFQDRLLNELLDLRMLRASIAGTPDRATLERESADDLREYCEGTDDTPGFERSDREEMLAAGYTAAEIARMEQRLVFDRNDDWIPKLEQAMAGGGVFVAVGADHLTGSRGVIAQLAARGWTVTRVRP